MKIVVIVPTYNEKINIEKLIPVLEEVFKKILKHDMQILVADDSSPDGTGDIVRGYMKKYDNLHLLEGQKNGLGAAYVRAMRYAMDKMDAYGVIEFDADFQHDPNNIPRLVEAMDDGYDYVIGSRYIKGGQVPKEWGIHRKLISFVGGSLFARIVLMMFKVHDTTSGLKLTKTEYLKRVDLEHLYSKYYAYKIQILYEIYRMGARIKEIPIIFYERKEGSSKITSKDLFDSFAVVIKLRIRDSKSFLKFLVVGGSGFAINAIILRILVEEAHFTPTVANLFGAAVAIFSNFNLNNFWTFNTDKITGIKQYLWKIINFYATSALGVIFIQTGIIFLGDKLIGQKYYFFYFIVGTGFLLIYNFTVYRFFIWRKKPLPSQDKQK